MMTLFGAIFGKPILHEWHKLFIWRTAVDGVPTKANFDRFFKIGDDICPLCKLEVESSIHLFALCPVAKSVWFNSYGFKNGFIRFLLGSGPYSILILPSFCKCFEPKDEFLMFGASCVMEFGS